MTICEHMADKKAPWCGTCWRCVDCADRLIDHDDDRCLQPSRTISRATCRCGQPAIVRSHGIGSVTLACEEHAVSREASDRSAAAIERQHGMRAWS